MFFLNEKNSKIKLATFLFVIAYLVVVSSKRVKVREGPTGMSYEDSTNCSDFAKFGRFNPYSVLHDRWFVFYYWAPVRRVTTYIFTAPSSNHTRRLKRLFEGNCVLPVQWNARQLLMEENRKYISLLVERSDRGEYWLYPVAKVRKNQKITPRDIRMKQTGDNRLVGILDCVDDTLLVMSRLNDVPPKGRLHEEASRLGYRGRKGKSYLYQGHEWGPVGEADESIFWDRSEKKISKDPSKNGKISEGSSEETEQPTIKPENSEEQKPTPKKSTVLAPLKPEDDEMCTKVMPELWNDPEPNPNPDNLLTKEDLKELDNMIDNNDILDIESPEGSTDNKQESNADNESENLPDNGNLHNHNDEHTTEKPVSTDNKKESNTDKESENPLKKSEIHNHKDTHKMESPDTTENKEESINTESENENPHNHKVCSATQDPDDDNEDCVVCYKSQVSYVSDESYIPDSARSMPVVKDNDDVPEKEANVEVPRFVIGGVELKLERQSHTEVPVPKEPSAKIQRTEVPTPKVQLTKTPRTDKQPGGTVPTRSSPPEQTNSSEIIYLTPKVLEGSQS